MTHYIHISNTIDQFFFFQDYCRLNLFSQFCSEIPRFISCNFYDQSILKLYPLSTYPKDSEWINNETNDLNFSLILSFLLKIFQSIMISKSYFPLNLEFLGYSLKRSYSKFLYPRVSLIPPFSLISLISHNTPNWLNLQAL